ncbi:MscL family protein, partial [Salmonella enterica]|uniref:MscL family protein n=1 Tax=Salmonella enterica TaxID=28901 RepID=UPI000CAE4B6C
FKDIVNALVDYIITPIIAGLSGNASVEYMTISIGPAEIGVGMFLQAIIDFFFIAIILFFIVKGVSSVVSRFEKEEEEELEPTPEEYLAEIRDILAASSDYSTSKVDQT